jgi:flagellar hook-associated protein 2
MSITPLKITGTSAFSEDLSLIIKRAVDIASLPIKLKTLADAVTKLGEIGQNKSLSASSSNANRVSVSLNGASLPASYTITEITSIAKAASENTVNGLPDADTTSVDVDDELELVLGGTVHRVDLSSYGNNLNGLRDAINALDAGVTASVLNTGSGPTPYYLTLSATSTGATTLQLRTTAGDAGSNIVTAANQGANAVFKLNDLDISRTDNVITDVIDGVTFTIVSPTEGAEVVAITLASSRGTLSAALGALVTAYNDVAGEVNKQIGETAGLLSGDGILRQIQNVMRRVAGYQGSGSVRSLAELGISLDKTGVMSFDSAAYFALSSTVFNNAFALLGSATTGFGGLSAEVRQLSDPVTGLIKTQQNNYDASDRRISKAILDMTERIERMQLTLSAKLQQADVLLSTLQSQQNMLDAALKSVSLVSFGKERG